jgi:dihydroorotate dehydrogenase
LIYRLFFALVLKRIDAELAHALAAWTLRFVTAIPPVRSALRRLAAPSDPCLQVRALGRTFPSPLGVAAGVDKDASWFEGLGLIGFGFVEVGTATARAQGGNPKPRVFRLTEDRAVLNRMGFPNPGAAVIGQRLRERHGATIVGVNVGKSKAAPAERISDDYRACVREVAPASDYLVVNVSSPNTPGLREMQAVELLRPLIANVRAELNECETEIPILIKIGPDLDGDQLDAVANLAVELGLDGIVAVNTTVSRDALNRSAATAERLEGGGVSGAPLKTRALEVLQHLHARVGGELVLISVGGIESAEDAWERIVAGATLVQAHTGFIYGGPAWPRRVNRALARRVREGGYSSIQTLVGAGNEGANGDPSMSRENGANSASAPARRRTSRV